MCTKVGAKCRYRARLVILGWLPCVHRCLLQILAISRAVICSAHTLDSRKYLAVLMALGKRRTHSMAMFLWGMAFRSLLLAMP